MSLEILFQELNRTHFSSELPLPILRWNSRLSTTAGRFSPGSRNPLKPRLPEIEVAAYLRELTDGADHIRDTILHEMIHYYLWFHKRPYGHTAEFHAILKKVGAKRYNTVPQLRAIKHWYECPACLVKVPARRKIGISACATCCKKHNGGQYSERFRLRIVGQNPAEISHSPKAEPKPLGVAEIIRRLEEIKGMILKHSMKKPL